MLVDQKVGMCHAEDLNSDDDVKPATCILTQAVLI